MRVLLDTTALYVAAGATDLAFTPDVQRLLEHPYTERLVSPVSFTEIAMKANKGLTPLRPKHLEDVILDLDLAILPLTVEHSLKLFGLPAHHSDPFDRMLIAIALAEDVSIVANDREFRKYDGLRVMW